MSSDGTALFPAQAEPWGNLLLGGLCRSAEVSPSPSPLPPPLQRTPSKHHCAFLPRGAGLSGCHFSLICQNCVFPSTVHGLPSDLPPRFFPGLTGWFKSERSPELRQTSLPLSRLSSPSPRMPTAPTLTFSLTLSGQASDTSFSLPPFPLMQNGQLAQGRVFLACGS